MIEILAATVVAQTNRIFFFCFCEAHGLVTNAYGTMGGRPKPEAKKICAIELKPAFS